MASRALHHHHRRRRLSSWWRLAVSAAAVLALSAVVGLAVAQTTGAIHLPGLGSYGRAPSGSTTTP